MSELREAAQAALTAYETFRDVDDIDGLDDAIDHLRAALAQHVTEVVAMEREELLDLVDSYAKDNTDLKDAIRARAEKETT